MRITFLIDNMNRGGAELVCLNQIRYMLAQGHKVDLVLLNFFGDRLSEIPDGIRLFVLEAPPPIPLNSSWNCSIPLENIRWVLPPHLSKLVKITTRFRGLWHMGYPIRCHRLIRLRHASSAIQFARYIKEKQPDIVLAHLLNSYITALLGRRMSKFNPPVICTIHNTFGYSYLDIKSKPMSIFMFLLPESDKVHAVSNGVASSVAKYVPEVAKKIVTIYNPIEVSEIKMLAQQPVKHSWFKKPDADNTFDSKIILTVGRLVAQKNHTLLIHAFSKVQSQMNIKLVILGEGELRSDIENLVRKLQLDSVVSIPGSVANPFAFMARADLFVLSSSWEGFGCVIVEALACGCPVVSTDCSSGPREILEGGRWGQLVQCDDVAALSNAIIATLGEEQYPADDLRKRAREFAPERIMKHYEKLVDSTIAGE